MAILRPLRDHELSDSDRKILNALIQSYNLTAHDRKPQRRELLQLMVKHINANHALHNETLTPWMNEKEGLMDNLHRYKVKELITPQVSHYKEALSKLNETSPNQNAIDTFKP